MSRGLPFRQLSTLPAEQQERIRKRFERAGVFPGPVTAPRGSNPERMHCGHPRDAVGLMDPRTLKLVSDEDAKGRSDLVEICKACSGVTT